MTAHLDAADPLTEPVAVTFAGDWHGVPLLAELALLSAADHGSQTVIQVGDFGLRDGHPGERYLDLLEQVCVTRELRLLVVPGNHENYDLLDAAPRTPSGLLVLRPHIHAFPRGYRWTWAGVRFLAMGGAVSIDKDELLPGRTWWPAEAVTADQVAAAAADGPADVLLTHDCPAGANIPGVGTGFEPLPDSATTRWRTILTEANAHRRLLRELVDAVQPTAVVHGHYHCRYTTTLRLRSGKQVTVTGLDREARPQDNVVHVTVADLVRTARAGRAAQ